MCLFKKSVSVLLLLLIAGVARLPFERPLGRAMRSDGILSQPIDFETTESLGQTSAAIALGGLRSLVAAVLNFSKVVPAWDERDWAKIFDTFEQIHTLQPEIGYYWEAAAGYAAHDAYSDYRDRPGVPEWQRKLRRDEFFLRGEAYLSEGITHLPENVRLYDMKARIRADSYKPEHIDYAKAAATLDEAVKLEHVTDVLRRYRLYLMSRVPERRLEALELVREIYQEPTFRFPSIKSLLFALQNEFPEAPGQQITKEQIYPTDAEFLRALFNHYQRRDENLPMTGVKEELDRLVAEMQLPYSLDPLRNHDIKRVTLNLSEIYQICPLHLPSAPYEDETHWPGIVELYQRHGTQSPPTVRALFVVLRHLAQVDPSERVPLGEIFPNKLYALRDLANHEYDLSHDFPRDGVRETLKKINDQLQLPNHLSPLTSPDRFPFDIAWMEEVQKWQLDSLSQL